jgi:hypothetical protein
LNRIPRRTPRLQKKAKQRIQSHCRPDVRTAFFMRLQPFFSAFLKIFWIFFKVYVILKSGNKKYFSDKN